MFRIADQSLTDRIDHEIEPFEGDLSDQDGTIVSDFGHVTSKIATLHSESNGVVDL